jgi:hypothetical protein
MATKREMEDMQAALAAELDGFGASLSSLHEQQENMASWIATLIRLLADAGAISRTAGPFATLLNREQPCLFCGEVH